MIFLILKKRKKDDEVFKISLKPKNFSKEVKNTKERIGGIDKEELKEKMEKDLVDIPTFKEGGK